MLPVLQSAIEFLSKILRELNRGQGRRMSKEIDADSTSRSSASSAMQNRLGSGESSTEEKTE